jgi:D-arginine dehydrogenase
MASASRRMGVIAKDPKFAADFIIIGAGIAGASVAFWLAPHARVILLERENQPGYHSTGRSAALYFESYGTPHVRALTLASRAFFEHPPQGFADNRLLTPRGALMVANEDQEELLERHWAILSSTTTTGKRMNRDDTCSLVPVLRTDRILGSAYEPDAFDIDVHALLQGYLRAVRQAGGSLVCNAEVFAIERMRDSWQVHASDAVYQAPVLINAAGAWVDATARMAGVAPIGIEPKRRSAFTFASPEGIDARRWPMVMSADEGWYIKPEGGVLLGSPANADTVKPHDVQPEEIDIALGIDRIEAMTALTIRRPTRIWAGLRSFVADGDLVGGFDDTVPGFFWVAAQGGYGIQTSPAMGEACAALARGLLIPYRVADFGISAAILSPGRLRRS